MKKLYLLVVTMIFATTIFAQTIVDTTIQNKNVVLEEFTGIHCGYCPQYGHKLGQQIHDAHPNDVFLINVQTGSYATPGAGEPDFRTSFGSAIVNQTSIYGYPAGTVNRHFFSAAMAQNSASPGTAMGLAECNTATNTTLGEISYVNVGCEASLDVQTRLLTVHVELYYTDSSPQSTNKLNVALIQNNIEGPQAGSSENPAQVLPNGNYNHMHMLRHLITGQWGAVIDSTTAGSFIDTTFTYIIPADLNGVAYVLGDLEIIAFVAEDNQEIISGNDCSITLTNFSTVTNAAISNLNVQSGLCPNINVQPELTITNWGSDTLTSLAFEYDFSGTGTTTYNWIGNLLPFTQTSVQLSNITYTSGTVDLNIKTTSTNGVADEDTTDNKLTISISEAPVTHNVVSFDIKPDNYGSEITWNIKNASGTTIMSGGPYSNSNTTLIHTQYTYTTTGCYTLDLRDSYGDGLLSGGYAKLYDSGTTYYYSGNYGSGIKLYFQPDIMSTVKTQVLDGVNIYPNPTKNVLNIVTKENSNIKIYNIMGEVVYSVNNSSNKVIVDMANMSKGTYIVKITNDNATAIQKVNLK